MPDIKEPVASEPLPVDFSDLNDPLGELDQLPSAPAAPLVQPVQPSAQSAAPTAPAHPPALLQAARDLGIRDSVIKALGTDDLIAHTMDLNRKLSALETGDSRRQQEQPRRSPEPELVRDNDESDDAILDYLQQDVGADPKLVKMLRARFKKQDELEQSEKQRRDRDQSEAQRRQNSSEEAIDAAFDHLGPKFEKLFGTGGLRGMADSPQKTKRMVVFRSAGIDFQNDSERAIERKIARAAIEAYGDVLPADAPVPTNGYEAKPPSGKTQEEWDRAALAKPTGTKPAKTRGQKAAAEAIRDRMQEMGIHSGINGDDDDLNGLPD